MRIIAGIAGGTNLFSPKNDARPTTDRAREAIFSKLAALVANARVADLFAGSGAMGLEALSRGAASAEFVENHCGACAVIRRNAEKTRLQAAAVVREMNVYTWLKRATGPYDLIFADPPYWQIEDSTDHLYALLNSPELPRLLAPEGVFVLESAAIRRFIIPFPWALLDQRTYGKSQITFLQLTSSYTAH